MDKSASSGAENLQRGSLKAISAVHVLAPSASLPTQRRSTTAELRQSFNGIQTEAWEKRDVVIIAEGPDGAAAALSR